MRPLGRELIRILSGTLPFRDPVVELGSYLVDGQQELADLRPFFADHEYVGCDLRPGPGVDRIEDVEALGFADGSVGSIVSVDALEHVRRPWLAAAEAHRVLAPGGVGVFVTCLDFKIHNHPDDYWRFTPSVLDDLFGDFPTRMIGSQGAPEFPHTVFAIVFQEPTRDEHRQLFDRLTIELRECRLPVPLAKRVKWRLGEWLIAKRWFGRLRRHQEIHLELRDSSLRARSDRDSPSPHTRA